MGCADKIQDLIQISEDEQNRIKEKVRKATERRKSVLEKVPYGYRFDQSQGMVPDPIPAEYVKFIFEKLAEYTENPPENWYRRSQTLIKKSMAVCSRMMRQNGKFLLQPLDVANPERLLADYREMIGEETSLSTWKRRVERMLDSAYCIGEMTYYSGLDKIPVRVADHHEPIISRELYASVYEKWKKIV